MEISITKAIIGTQAREISFRAFGSDMAIIKQTFDTQELAMESFQRWAEIVEWVVEVDRPLIVDCGAYIGSTAIWFAIRHPRANVVALEPDDENYELLRRNTQGLRVDPMKMGVSCRPGNAIVLQDQGGHAARTQIEMQPGGIVPLIDLNTIYKWRAEWTPFIVKVDIEGHESVLFAENLEWIDRTPIIIMEPHDWLYPKQGTSRSFMEAVASRPRDLVIRGEYLFSIAHDLNCGEIK